MDYPNKHSRPQNVICGHNLLLITKMAQHKNNKLEQINYLIITTLNDYETYEG